MNDVPKEIKTRSDAEKCVRVLFREMGDGTKVVLVQLVSPTYCDKCGHEELRWRDLHSFPLKDDTKATYKDRVGAARKARMNTIDMLMQNTIVMERIIKG